MNNNENKTDQAVGSYFVGFQRLNNNKVGHAVFSAVSESDAKHAFRECYRHGNYKILCCVKL